jgi:hypothetical protein
MAVVDHASFVASIPRRGCLVTCSMDGRREWRLYGSALSRTSRLGDDAPWRTAADLMEVAVRDGAEDGVARPDHAGSIGGHPGRALGTRFAPVMGTSNGCESRHRGNSSRQLIEASRRGISSRQLIEASRRGISSRHLIEATHRGISSRHLIEAISSRQKL